MIIHDDNDNENHVMEHEVLLNEDEEQQFLNDLDGPDIVEAATTTQEELFDSLLPPLNHVVIPNASRRRAHTVEAETPRRASESIILVRSTIGDDLSLLFDDDDSTLGVSLEDEDDEGEVEEDPSFLRPIGGQQRPLRLTLSQESRLQRRQKLVNSRCVRGFMLLCVYGILVLQPSLTADTTNSSASLVEPLDTPTTVKTTTTAASGAASVKQDDNEKAESPSSSSKTTATKATPRKTLPLENLPNFRRRPKGSGFKTPPPPARRSASAAASQPQQQQQEHKGQPEKEQHMALPPHIYHKKQRPILSAAHSYQLHQEPLFFGRELKTSFVLESSDGDRERPSPIPWGTTLIWLSLICLLCDTSYREWQYYRWHRQHSSSSSSSNNNNNNNARSRHHRRSPSPVPNSRQNSRNNHHHRHRARQQQRRRPQRPRFDSF